MKVEIDGLLKQVLARPLFVAGLMAFAVASPARAWDDHTLPTYIALGGVPSVAHEGPLEVETIEGFLREEREGLERLLADEETWARENVAKYPPRPTALEFHAQSPDLRLAFLRALRVNPEIKLALYLQNIPGTGASGRPAMAWQSVTTLDHAPDQGVSTYGGLREGERVSALEVVATASDEPDYGTDIGLWSDSGTSIGARYAFGAQPFGNGATSISTQAPFHMGFFHERGIIYAADGDLKRAYPEMRVHQALSLARYALQTGHRYWGWRFMGWGLHYLQDLTQPYHATMLPGVSTTRDLWVYGEATLFGRSKPKQDLIQLVTNRHFALEVYELQSLLTALQGGDTQNPVVKALASAVPDRSSSAYDDRYLRDVVTVEARSMADRSNTTILKSLPARWVNDPTYLFGTTEPEPNVLAYLKTSGTGEASQEMSRLLAALMKNLGEHSRAFVRAALVE